MKQIANLFIAGLILVGNGVAAQDVKQAIPPSVTEIHLQDNTSLTIDASKTNESFLEMATHDQAAATIKSTKMTISGSVDHATIHLANNQSITLSAEDNATIVINCPLPMRQWLTFRVEDNAGVIIRGVGDTLFCNNLTIQAEDNATINSEAFIWTAQNSLTAEDNATITLSGIRQDKMFNSKINVSDAARINRGDLYNDTSFYKKDQTHINFGDSEGTSSESHSYYYGPDASLQFSWGFHNWSNSHNPYNGLQGIEGVGAIRTTFNHLQLSLNYPIFYTRYIGAFIGLGLDWDKYKFNSSDPISIMNNSFVEGFGNERGYVNEVSTALYTRYIILPITLRFNLGRSTDWHLEFTAIPGLGWTGKHTGMEYQESSNQREIEYRSFDANNYLNPFKLDARVALRYEGIGIYVQVPTMSVFKDSFEKPYFPVRFGINIALE